MDIGKPKREIEVIPEQEPVPSRVSEPIAEPEPDLVPQRENRRWQN